MPLTFSKLLLVAQSITSQIMGHFEGNPKSCLCMAALTAICLSGCGPRPYRRGTPFVSGKNALAPVVEPDLTRSCKALGPGCVQNTLNQIEPQAFSLAYIEFDDAGELWSIGNLRKDRFGKYPPSQLQLAVDLVMRKRAEAAAQHRSFIVIGFVHGWQNNASLHDETSRSLKNLASFKNSLQFIATHCQRTVLVKSDECPVVVGIFFAWRGRTIPITGIHALSYRSRRDAANRVGGPSMTEAVTLLSIAVRGGPAKYDVRTRCRPTDESAELDSRFLLVGHSFGARALEHGVTQPLLSLILEEKAAAEKCVASWNSIHGPSEQLTPRIMPPFDLIALINPANDALEAKSMIEAFKRAGLESDAFEHPLIVSVKSEGDWATGPIMWWGQSLVAGRPPHRSYDRAPGPTACEQGQLGLKDQSFYYRRSPGGILNMASHQITEVVAKDESACTALDTADRRHFWGDISPSGVGGKCFEVRSVRSILAQDGGKYAGDAKQYYSCSPALYGERAVPVWNDTPYFVMKAPSSFIRDHDDVFQRGLYNFLLLMMGEDRTFAIH